MARKLVILAVLLLAGAAMSIAIAVLAAMFSPITPRGRLTYDSPHSNSSLRRTPPDSLRSFVPDHWIDFEPGTNSMYSLFHNRHAGPAITVDTFVTDLHYLGLNPVTVGNRLAIGVRVGWPLPSLRCAGVVEPMPGWARRAAVTPVEWKGAGGETTLEFDVTTILDRLTVNRPIPASILPVGLAINSLFFAGALGVPLLLLTHLRRYRRLLGGHCPQCAYDLTNLRACPECDWAPRSPGPGE